MISTVNTKEYISNIIDPTTGEVATYEQVTTYVDGTAMTNGKVDGVIYRRKGTKFYKRTIGTALNALWFGVVRDYNPTTNT
jgi:hypothetical protein